jgi:hypothetical protein
MDGPNTLPGVILKRELRFQTMLWSSVVGAIVQSLVSIPLAYIGMRYWALVGAFFAGQIVVTVCYCRCPKPCPLSRTRCPTTCLGVSIAQLMSGATSNNTSRIQPHFDNAPKRSHRVCPTSFPRTPSRINGWRCFDRWEKQRSTPTMLNYDAALPMTKQSTHIHSFPSSAPDVHLRGKLAIG